MHVTKKKQDAPDSEVLERPKRRRYIAEYKLRILREAEESDRGEVGALLRREGLHSSHLTEWRKQRDRGALAALEPQKRGRKPSRRQDPVARENERLRKENARLERRLKQAEAVIAVQKKSRRSWASR
ncbi:MAG: transposase [Deltaproteobacteria bacterium]|nr:transposase [Deltaproteobacteria bacterium]